MPSEEVIEEPVGGVTDLLAPRAAVGEGHFFFSRWLSIQWMRSSCSYDRADRIARIPVHPQEKQRAYVMGYFTFSPDT